MNHHRSDDLGPWGFRILLGTRLRRTLIISASVAVAWTTFQVLLQLFYVLR
jgi:hypothetical protein